MTIRSEVPRLVIHPAKGLSALNLKELWLYRELIFFLTWRDIKVRYKQAVLGIAWAVIQPVVNMVIFSIIFGNLAKLDSGGVPYPLLSYSALLPWQLFASGLQKSSTSLVGNSNLITKVYFPRLAIPLSAVVSGLIDFGISSLVLVGIMVYYHQTVTWNALWLPLLILLALLTALAFGLWLSALNVLYRDIQHMVPFLITTWMYASPVAYTANLIPEGPWRIIYGLNPMAGVIQGFRWVLLGSQPPGAMMIISVVMVLVLLVSGLFFFRNMEKTFADKV